MIIWPAKDPAEELDYSWTIPLDSGDEVDSFTATKISGSVDLGSSDYAGAVGSLWLSGGTADELAYINLEAVTLDGRKFREVGVLPLVDRASAVLADFRLTYPEFAATDDGRIGFFLAKAGTVVGDNWSEATRDPAKIAWVAHQIASAPVAGMPAGVTSFKSADFSATFSEAAVSRVGYAATIYGREFARYQRQFAGPYLTELGCVR